MAGFADTLGGDGLARAQRALAGLARDAPRLDRERQRFSHSPPPYTSDLSGSVTRSASPIPPREERRQQRRMQLAGECEASEPQKQFSAQVEEERRRICNADPNMSWRESTMVDLYRFKEEASEKVKKRWVEQGIWNDKWNKFASGRWKHEEPLELELESESESDSKARLPPPLFSTSPKPQPKRRPPKSDDEQRRAAERRVILEREREASRPYHQFVYQISKERERIQEFATDGGADTADINTRAYKNIKRTWTKRGVWDKRWGVLPGMSWKHERPFEELVREEMGDDTVPANRLVNGSYDAPATRIFESPAPVQSNRLGALNSSQQGLPADIASARSGNGDVERSPSSPNSPPFSSGKRALRATMEHELLPSKRKATHKDGQPANASLSPVHSSKVTKAAGKRKGSQRRLNIAQKVSSSVNTAEPEPSPPSDRGTPRRSKRIHPPVSSVAKDPPKMASTDPSKPALRPKPERKVASNLTARSSAKPQGVLKRQPAQTARGKARKR